MKDMIGLFEFVFVRFFRISGYVVTAGLSVCLALNTLWYMFVLYHSDLDAIAGNNFKYFVLAVFQIIAIVSVSINYVRYCIACYVIEFISIVLVSVLVLYMNEVFNLAPGSEPEQAFVFFHNHFREGYDLQSDIDLIVKGAQEGGWYLIFVGCYYGARVYIARKGWRLR